MDHQHSAEEADAGVHQGFTRQRRPKTDPLCCPICGVTLRANEIDQHFALEVERLDKILKPRRNNLQHCSTSGFGVAGGTTDRASSTAVPGTSAGTGGATSSSAGLANGQQRSLEDNGEPGPASSCPVECWGTYQKIKNNRQARLKMKTRKRKTEDNVCPVCNKSVSEEITAHVEACLRRSETNGSGSSNGRMNDSDDDDASIDVEGESYEVYEWAGQTRIRATTMLHQSGAFPSTAMRVTNAEDTDDELNVDGDETQIYGPPQYSERDVVYPVAEQRCKDSYLRGLVMANEPVTVKRPEVDNPGEGPSWGSTLTPIVAQSVCVKAEQRNGESTDQIVASLKPSYS